MPSWNTNLPFPAPVRPLIDGAITASTLSIDATSWMPPRWAVASQVASQQMVGARAEGLHLNTEGEGFEPPKACTLVVFKTTAIDHSAIPPATSK